MGKMARMTLQPQLSSSAKADDRVFQTGQVMEPEAAAYWMPRLRGA
jgi:hypothetical protein